MFDYDYMPEKRLPVPVIDIVISSANDNKFHAEIPATINTSVDFLYVPNNILRKLSCKVYKQYFLKDKITGERFIDPGTGNPVKCKTFLINLKAKNCKFLNCEVAGSNKKYAEIGNNILNRYKLILDGPNKKWSIDSKCDKTLNLIDFSTKN